MKSRLIITIVTNVLYEGAILAGLVWLLPLTGMVVPLWLVVLCMVGFAAWAVFCYDIGSRTLRKKPLEGLTDMTGSEGWVSSRLKPDGFVRIQGELWAARAESGEIPTGALVEVIGQKGLKLVVRLKPDDLI